MSKQTFVENQERIKIPHREVICPCCGNKILFEEHLCSFCPTVYCHYCGQKITYSMYCKP